MQKMEQKKAVEVFMLGCIRLEVEGRVLTDDINRALKLWNVLAYLIYHRGREIPQSEFIEQFWDKGGDSNPGNALKTLLFRIRAMLEPVFGPNVEPIRACRGAYTWNMDLDCELDIDRFAALCLAGEDESRPLAARAAACRAAVELYRGDFLSRLSNRLWVVPIANQYHTMYLKMVKTLAAMLAKDGLWEEIEALCRRANALDELDEGIHLLLIQALIGQGRKSEALTHYISAVDLRYRTLGLRPSEEMRGIYTQLMDVEQEQETDLEVIQRDLREAARQPGAFFCEYGFFREAYRLELRRAERVGEAMHLGLITVDRSDGSPAAPQMLAAAMDQVGGALRGSLRRGDVVAKYSASQYVVMLPFASMEDSEKVLERVIAVYRRKNRRSIMRVSYRVRAME